MDHELPFAPGHTGTHPAYTLLSAKPTKEELQRWSALVYQGFVKNGNLGNIREDMKFIATRCLNINYHPLWFIKNRLLSGYIGRDTGSLYLPDFDFSGGIALYDLLLLNEAVDVINNMQQRKEQTLLIVPIHIKTLCDRRALKIFAHYCEAHASLARRNLVFMLEGIEDGRMLPSDYESIQQALAFCRAFIIDAPPKNMSFAQYIANLKVHACGFDAKKFSGTEEQLFEHLNKYAETCDKFGTRSFVTGVDKASILSAAIAAGITYLEGSAISDTTKTPRHAEFLGIDNVYQHIFPE